MKNIIAIDGVVGVGKSTLMNILGAKGYRPFPEPVLENPILEKFYNDRKRYSFPSQVFFLNRRFQHIKMACEIEDAIMDRSIYGDAIFAKMLMESNEMSREEYEIYSDLFKTMLDLCPAPSLMVYLEISTEAVLKRIQKRGRAFEQKVEVAYWEKLNKHYDYLFTHYNHSPLLKINVEALDFENNPEHQSYVLGLIEDKLQEINGQAKDE